MAEILVEELRDAPDPFQACTRFLDAPLPLLLESVVRSEELGRFSYLTADPWLVLESKGTRLERRTREGVERGSGDPFAALQALLAEYACESLPDLPAFQGGVAGYLAYDLCHHLERLPSPRFDDLDLPDLAWALYDWMLAWDHVSRTHMAALLGPAGSRPRGRMRRAEARARMVRERLVAPVREPLAIPPRRSDRRPSGRGPTRSAACPGSCSTFSRPGLFARRWHGSASTSSPATSSRPTSRSASRPPARRVTPFDLYRRLAARESRPLRRLPRFRRRGARRAPRRSGSCALADGQRGDAADQGHAAARPDAGAGPRARRGARREREGPRRERDDRRPAAQRPVARVRDRHGARSPSCARSSTTPRCTTWSRRSPASCGPALGRGGPAARRVPRRLDHRGAEDPRHGDHRRAGADAARRLLRRDRLLARFDGGMDTNIAIRTYRRCAATASTSRRAAASSPTPSPSGSTRRRSTRRGASSRRWGRPMILLDR